MIFTLGPGASAAVARAVINMAEAALPKNKGRPGTGITAGGNGSTSTSAGIHGLHMLSVLSGQDGNDLTEVAANCDLNGEVAESSDASADARIWHPRFRRGAIAPMGRVSRPKRKSIQ